MLLRLPTPLVDSVTGYIEWRDVLSLGAVSKAAAEAASTRIDAYMEELAVQPATEGQGVLLARALSQSIVLALSASIEAEEMYESSLLENGYWGDEFSRSGRGGHALRPRGMRQDPRANLLKDHRLLLGRPLYGRVAWYSASVVLGRPPFGDEWWSRPRLIDAVALALKEAHCGFCGKHLDAENAEDVIYERGAPHNVRHLCSICNAAQSGHIMRQVKNDLVRVRRESRRLWKFCTQENPACYNWHHGTQDRCECPCHGVTDE
jgi:hypothetical protein